MQTHYVEQSLEPSLLPTQADHDEDYISSSTLSAEASSGTLSLMSSTDESGANGGPERPLVPSNPRHVHDLPEAEVQAVELPAFDLPEIDLPAIDLPANEQSDSRSQRGKRATRRQITKDRSNSTSATPEAPTGPSTSEPCGAGSWFDPNDPFVHCITSLSEEIPCMDCGQTEQHSFDCNLNSMSFLTDQHSTWLIGIRRDWTAQRSQCASAP